MSLVVYSVLFLIGTVMGSFLGVIIERGRWGFSRRQVSGIFWGRSYCPGCNQHLSWRQLIPIVGREIQRGRCVHCGLSIPSWYSRLELTSGLLFVVTTWLVVGGDVDWTMLLVDAPAAFWISLLFRILIGRAYLWIIVADLLWYELNIYLRLFLVVWTVGFQVGALVPGGVWWVIWWGSFAALFALISRWGKWLVLSLHGRALEAMGEWDVLVAFVIGALFVYLPVPSSMIAIYQLQLVAVYLVLSSGIGLIYRIVRRAATGQQTHYIPFLPAMIVAFFIVRAMSPIRLDYLHLG
jgi:prepilin signal peptidase PulO-like enzyme (type II secretory pathway)